MSSKDLIQDLETDYIEDPTQYEKPKIQNFSLHRLYKQNYCWFATKIFGGHDWIFYKPSADKTISINKYFDDYDKYKKQLQNLFKTIDPTWIPLNHLYISIEYGTYKQDINRTLIRKLDLQIPEEKQFFYDTNKLTIQDFCLWCLIVANWEFITCTKDIVDRFYYLYERFKIYCRLDMTPDQVMLYFNNKLKDLSKHNIEPLKTIQLHTYYNFVMNPKIHEISVKSGLDKLFLCIAASDYLKGVFASFKPNFDKYIQQLDYIFGFKYCKYSSSIDNTRRLSEHEAFYYDLNDNLRIMYDVYIPKVIKEKYSLVPIQTDIIEPVTQDEYDKYLQIIKRNEDIAFQQKISKRNNLYDKYKKTNDSSITKDIIFNFVKNK